MATFGPLSPTKELGYAVKRESLLLAGKGAVVEPLAITAGSAAIGSVAGVLLMGAAAALAAGLSQMDFTHKKDVLRDMYREELASQLGKQKSTITDEDVETFAKSNKTIGQELQRSTKQRNFGVAVSFVATLAATAVALAPVLGAVTLAGIGISGLGVGIVQAVMGFLTYKAVEAPLHYVADKAFGLDNKTTNDYIAGIERDREIGNVISREQVLSVFVASNPELDRLIVTNSGKHFNDLALADKQRATEQMSQLIPLDKITLDINVGRVNAAELAFAVDGKTSGVTHDGAQISEERKGGLKAVLDDVGVNLNKSIIAQSKLGHRVERMLTSALASQQGIIPVDTPAPRRAQSFVERLGLHRKDPTISFTDGVEQSRNHSAITAI